MDEKSSGDDNIKPNSNNSSDEEDIKIFNEIENNSNDNMIVESEGDNLNESMDDLESKDNEKIIDNFIKLFHEFKIDNNMNSINNENECYNNKMSDEDDNKNIIEEGKFNNDKIQNKQTIKEKSSDINIKGENNWIKKNLKDRNSNKLKQVKKVDTITKKYKYPKK